MAFVASDLDSNLNPLDKQEGKAMNGSKDESRATNGAKDGYRLGRSYVPATRLNLQHFVYKDTQGFLIHPAIQEYLRNQKASGSELLISDIGTGTGIWIFDLAKSPEIKDMNVQLHGFDVSTVLFPHRAWLPKNITLSVLDLLKKPPEELRGKFDVVHVRLILSVIRSDGAERVIRNLKALLKPGGYMQWDELDPLNHYDVITPTPDVEAPNMKASFARVKGLADWSWIGKLPQTLLAEGFEESFQHHYEPAPEMLKTWTYMELCANEELSKNWLGSMEDTDSREEAERWMRIIPKAYEEADESIGAVLRVRPTVTVARRPL